MPSVNWQRKPFGSCAELVAEKVRPEEMGDSGYIGLEHIGEGSLSLLGSGVASDVTSTKSRFREGDILFGKLRPYFRKLIRAPFEGICSTDIWVVRPLERVDAGFLFYLMATERFIDFATRGSQGTRMPRAKWEFVTRLQIELPTLAEQRSIAQVLSVLDDKIELNRRMNETLETMAQSIFEDWFVDFGPIRAKVTGDPMYLPNDLWELFPEDFDNDGIPIGWSQQDLGSSFNVRIGRTPPRKEQHHFLPIGEGVTWLSIKDMKDIQTFALSSAEHLTENAVEEFRIPVIPAGTVLVSFKLTVGRVAIAGKDMCSNEAIAQLRPDDQTPVSYPFTYCYMKAFDYDSLASTSSIATAVNSKSIKAIRMTIPDPATHAAFVKIAQPIFDQILMNCRESDSITSIREILLPKLISGEIRVKDAENIVESVT